jgi:2-dehydro-3-deoxyphosphogalactonate aldolase
MKIADFRTYVVSAERQPIWVFLKLITDEGIEGWGERPASQVGRVDGQVHLLESMVRHFVVGQDPFSIERIWHKFFASRHDFRHPSLDSTPALGAVEIACWDIVGKALKQPIYNLLGGRFHDQLRSYAYMPHEGFLETPEKAGEVAQQLVDEGNSACKLDLFYPCPTKPWDFSLQHIRKVAKVFACIRAAVGDDLEIAIGTHGQFSTAGAIRVAKELEEFSPYWFEEPVPPENVEEMARVAAHTSIPIASGERLATKYEFSELLEKRAAQVIQVDVAQCGGILEAKKIAAMAETHYAMIAPHMYCGPIAGAAAIQVDTCSPNFLIQELNMFPLTNEAVKEPIQAERGFITPPSGPGLGVELDEEFLRAHAANV